MNAFFRSHKPYDVGDTYQTNDGTDNAYIHAVSHLHQEIITVLKAMDILQGKMTM